MGKRENTFHTKWHLSRVREKHKNMRKKMTMADINPPISLITLNVNGMNTRRQRSYWQNVIQIESRMVVARIVGREGK